MGRTLTSGAVSGVEGEWKKAFAYETAHVRNLLTLRFDLRAIRRDLTPETVRKGPPCAASAIVSRTTRDWTNFS